MRGSISEWAWALGCLLVACGGTRGETGDAGGRDATRPPADAALEGGSDAGGGMDAALEGGSDAGGGMDAGATVACREPSECVLEPAGCCEPCGRPSLDAYDAVHVREREAHRERVCPDPSAEPCPRCATFSSPNLGATCNRASERCEAFDVERHAVSACFDDTDCVLRLAGCCECTGGEVLPAQLVALASSKVADYRAMVCDSDTACAACVPTYPSSARAVCLEGHCKVQIAGE